MKVGARQEQRTRRRARIRARIKGTAERPRMSVFRSNRFVYVQLINDAAGVTVAAATNRTSAKKSAAKHAKTAAPLKAEAIGRQVAERAQELGIGAAVFDRGGYRYHGLVKAIAEGARSGGLKL